MTEDPGVLAGQDRVKLISMQKMAESSSLAAPSETWGTAVCPKLKRAGCVLFLSPNDNINESEVM
jgi:hypothetical protein